MLLKIIRTTYLCDIGGKSYAKALLFLDLLSMRITLLILIIISFQNVMSQTDISFSHISVEDGIGLNSDMVYTIHQDEVGFIWVGTANGLQRFDGSKFASFGVSNPKQGQLPLSALAQIIANNNKELWLSFPNRREVGLYQISNSTYKIIPFKISRPLPDRLEYKLWKDNKGNVFITVFRFGVLQYDPSLDAFVDSNPFSLPKGWNPSLFSFEDTLEQKVWLPCPDSGLAMFDQKTRKLYTNKSNAIGHPILGLKVIYPHVTEIFIDSKKQYWIFSWDTTQHKRCFTKEGTFLKDATKGLNVGSGYQELRYFHESKNGNLWLYGNNALYKYDRYQQVFEFISGNTHTKGSIEYGMVHHIIEDHDGSHWIATNNGIYYISESAGSKNVINLQFSKPNTTYDITDIVQLKSGEYWLSSWGTGIITLTTRLQQYDNQILKELTKNFKDPIIASRFKQIWALYEQADGKIWMGCQAGQLMVHDPQQNKTKYLFCKNAEEATIRYITANKLGIIFFGTQRGHIISFDGKQFKTLHRFNTIVRKIFIDNDQNIWVALEGGGLYKLSQDGKQVLFHFTRENKRHTLFQNLVYDIEQLNDSTMICAAGALNFIHNKNHRVQWLTVENGLPSNSVSRIRKDQNGYFWMITNNGLSRYNPNNKRITNYNRRDGVIVAKETDQADFLCSENYIMFAGASSLLFFKPDAFDSKQAPPKVHLTEFRVLDKPLSIDSITQLKEVRLLSHQNNILISFASLSYLQREKLTYYYKLSGIHTNWIKANKQGEVNFNLLPPGKYEFSMFAETIDGKQSERVILLRIIIQRPFWKTGWFISTCIFISLLIIYAIHRVRINQILAIEKVRNRVARDLHDDMGSTLSTINILSTMSKSKLATDIVKTSEYLNKISDNAQRMMEAMDDIVWAIKPANDSMQKVIARMREFATNLLEAKTIDCRFYVDEEVEGIKLDMEKRRDLFLIFKESINNTAKYSHASLVEITISIKSNQLILEIKDNGMGFDMQQQEQGNGIGNMRKRADFLHAQLNINSKPNGGTQILLTMFI